MNSTDDCQFLTLSCYIVLFYTKTLNYYQILSLTGKRPYCLLRSTTEMKLESSGKGVHSWYFKFDAKKASTKNKLEFYPQNLNMFLLASTETTNFLYTSTNFAEFSSLFLLTTRFKTLAIYKSLKRNLNRRSFKIAKNQWPVYFSLVSKKLWNYNFQWKQLPNWSKNCYFVLTSEDWAINLFVKFENFIQFLIDN